MIIGDNHFINARILKSSVILENVPQLRTLAAQIDTLSKVCQTCSGTASDRQRLEAIWNDLRQMLLQLPEDKRKVIRDIAGSGQPIRIAYRVGSGETTRIESGHL